MKLLIELPTPINSGSGVVAINHGKELCKQGHDIYFATSSNERKTNIELGLPDNIHVEFIIHNNGNNDDWDVSFLVPAFSEGLKNPRFIDLTEEQRDEYIEVYTKKYKAIINDFQPDIIHSHHLFITNQIIEEIAPNIPHVCHSHQTAERMMIETKSKMLLPFVKKGVQTVDRIIAISDDVANQIIDLYDIPKDKITTIYNGYNPDVFYPRKLNRQEILKKYGIQDKFKKIVLLVAKDSEWKGQRYFISAARFLDKRNLYLIAGNGVLRNEYEGQIKNLNLQDYVKYITPPPNRTDLISELMGIADIFVLPSFKEGFGNVVIEELASGCPVVFSNSGGPKEYIIKSLLEKQFAIPVDPLNTLDGKFQIDPNDEVNYTHRIADGINTLLQKNITFEDKQFISSSVEHLSWQNICQKLTEVYYELL